MEPLRKRKRGRPRKVPPSPALVNAAEAVQLEDKVVNLRTTVEGCKQLVECIGKTCKVITTVCPTYTTKEI